jgi:DNA recombination protein RmuC
VAQANRVVADHGMKTLENLRAMQATLQQLIQQQEEARKLGESLRDIFQAPKLRGSFGEKVLEEYLAAALPEGTWRRQHPVEGGERVDAALLFNEVVIPVDAKFPREAYNRYLGAEAPEDRKRFWKEHEAAVKVHIKSIKAKYVKPQKGTTDFALMFIPSESVYYETVAEKNAFGEENGIYDAAREAGIIPVSPATFYPFLHLLLMGLQNLEIVKSAQKLKESLAKLEGHFEAFHAQFATVGDALEKAQKAYGTAETHIGRYRNAVDKAVNLKELDALAEEPPAEKS